MPLASCYVFGSDHVSKIPLARTPNQGSGLSVRYAMLWLSESPFLHNKANYTFYFLFSRGHATLHLAMLVGRSVGRSVQNISKFASG